MRSHIRRWWNLRIIYRVWGDLGLFIPRLLHVSFKFLHIVLSGIFKLSFHETIKENFAYFVYHLLRNHLYQSSYFCRKNFKFVEKISENIFVEKKINFLFDTPLFLYQIKEQWTFSSVSWIFQNMILSDYDVPAKQINKLENQNY